MVDIKSIENEEFLSWPVVGKGDERICYQNPNIPTRCIKVSHKKKSKQSKRELKYYSYLNSKKIPFTHIPKFYNKIETKEYLGMEQEFFCVSSGTKLKSVYEYLNVTLPLDELQQFLNAMASLKNYLLQYNIIPCDLVMSNMLVSNVNGNIKVIIIDGLGSTEFIPLSQYVRCLGKNKIERKWKFFIVKVLEPHFNKFNSGDIKRAFGYD